MKIILHAKNIELTSAIKSFVDKKIGSLSRFLKDSKSDLIETRVEVGRPSRRHKSGPVFYAEANLKTGGKLFRASEERSDLYAAIDRVRDELEIQIKKFKGQISNSRRQSAKN